MAKDRDWFKSLDVEGDFSSQALDKCFHYVQEVLKNDMEFVGKRVPFWRRLSYIVRILAFAAVAAGVLLPIPLFDTEPGRPNGLELGYISVLAGGLVLLADRTFNISSAWVRLTLAEMKMKQVRYRLDLDWARRRPLLSTNPAVEGPALVDLLKAAMDAGHDVMEAQKTAWTTEVTQAMEALRGRLDNDRLTLEQLRSQQRQDRDRPTTGAINLTISAPANLKPPLTVIVGDAERIKYDTVPPHLSIGGIPAGLQTIRLKASPATGSAPFDYSVTEMIVAGEVKPITVPT
jgi:hypothetical protein